MSGKKKSRRDLSKKASPRRAIALWKKVLFSLVPLAVVLGGAELVLWAAGVERLIDREDPSRGFSGLTTVFEREGDVYRTRPAVSGGTFNQQSFAVHKPEKAVRLFCLGGSSSYGFPWGAEAAFTAILGDVLADAHPDRSIEAINASGVSYAMHRLNIVADELLEYEPDIFVIYSGHNEFIEPEFFDALKHRSEARNRLEYLLAHTRTYSGLYSLINGWTAKRAATDEFGARVKRNDMRRFTPEEKEVVVREYRERLERLVKKAHSRGVKVLLATVPCNLRDWRPDASLSEAVLSEDETRRWTEAFLAGQSHLEQGEPSEALEDLRQALRLCSDHAETHYLAARCYERLSKWDEARRAYELACDYDASPSRRTSDINRAIRDIADAKGTAFVDLDRVFRDLSEHGLVGFNLIEDYVHPTLAGHQEIAWQLWNAIESKAWVDEGVAVSHERFDRVVASRGSLVNESNGVWLYNQGIVLQNQGSDIEAIVKFRQALGLLPNHEGALANLAKLLAKHGNPTEALPLARQLVQSNPDHPSYHLLLAEILAADGLADQAAQQYQILIDRWPRTARAYTGLGSLHLRRGEFALAKTQLEAALHISSDDAEAHYSLGLIAEMERDPNTARAHYEQALRARPDYAAAHCNLGTLLFRQGDPVHAEAEYRLAIRNRPDYSIAHANLAVLLQTLGDASAAESHFRRALEVEPDHLPALNNLAWLLATSSDQTIRDPEEALKLAARAAELTQFKHPGCLSTLAAAHAAAAQFDEAVKWLEACMALVPPPQQGPYRRRLEFYRRSDTSADAPTSDPQDTQSD